MPIAFYFCHDSGEERYPAVPGWEREREMAGRATLILKGFRKAETMTKLKWYCVSSPPLSLSLSFLLSFSITLSSYNLCLSVFLIDTPISRRFHASRIPNGSGLMTNRSIFIDLKVAGLENCLTIFKSPQSHGGTLPGLLLSRGSSNGIVVLLS